MKEAIDEKITILIFDEEFEDRYLMIQRILALIERIDKKYKILIFDNDDDYYYLRKRIYTSNKCIDEEIVMVMFDDSFIKMRIYM